MQIIPTSPQQAEDNAYYREVLHKVIHIATDLAESIHQKAAQPPETTSTPEDPTIPFDRIARAIRRTIALAQSLNNPNQPQKTRKPPQDRTAARKQIIRSTEDSIFSNAKGPRAESLREELSDRMEGPEFEHDLETRPVEDIIRDICDDLGLNGIPGIQLWKRRTPEDIRILHARAAEPPRPASQAKPKERAGPDPRTRQAVMQENILLCQALLARKP